MSTVSLSKTTSEALTSLDIVGSIFEVESVDRMAWVLCVLKYVEDSPLRFPRGKWATIQHIESQVDAAAAALAEGLCKVGENL